MGTFSDKTDYLLETKSKFKDRLNSLGASITSSTTFRNYLVWLDNLYNKLLNMNIFGLPNSLEGQTTQTGTPTPTTPQPINITTGEQNVWIAQNQLLPPNWQQGMISTSDGITISANNYWVYTPEFLDIHNLDNITVSFKETCRTVVFFYNENKVKVAQNQGFTSDNIRTYQPSTNNYYYMRIGYNLNGTAEATNPTTIYNHEPMVNKGTTALPYEKGNTYEINLGKNIFDGINKETFISAAANQCNVYPGNVGGYIRVDGGKYTISTTTTQTKYRVGCVNTIPGTSLAPCYKGVNKDNTTSTITIDTTGYQYLIVYATDLSAIQVEKGSIASSYSPYKTPIYLGKIGTYQDYIFKNTTENPLYNSTLEEGQWYIHKEIGRYDFTGTENFSASQWGTNSWGLENTISTQYNTNELQIMSNLFKGIPHANRITGGNNIIYTYSNTGFEIRNTTYSTLTDIRNATKGSYIYWVLATPTNTLIEDEELINQLNEIDIFTVISEDFYN